MATANEVTCERDGTPTKLSCVQCRTPICPQCLVKTPVGMKCPRCGAPGAARHRGSRTPVIAGVAVLVAAAAIGVPLLLRGSGSSPPPNTVAAGVRSSFSPPVGFGHIGTEVLDGDLAFTVGSFQCGATQVINGTVTRVAQGRFCMLAIDMHNTGRNPATFLLPAQMLRDDQGRMFGPDLTATAADPDNAGRDFGALVVNPGNQVHGVLVYDLPPAEMPTYVNLHASPTGPGAYVALVA